MAHLGSTVHWSHPVFSGPVFLTTGQRVRRGGRLKGKARVPPALSVSHLRHSTISSVKDIPVFFSPYYYFSVKGYEPSG